MSGLITAAVVGVVGSAAVGHDARVKANREADKAKKEMEAKEKAAMEELEAEKAASAEKESKIKKTRADRSAQKSKMRRKAGRAGTILTGGGKDPGLGGTGQAPGAGGGKTLLGN